MRDIRSHLVQWSWVAVAAALLTGSAALRPSLDLMSVQYGLVKEGIVAEQHSALAVALSLLPGGLRAPILAWVWIDTEHMVKDKRRTHDALERADLICTLQPQFVGVWVFQAWNMAYNLSADQKTPDHRWLWVNNGITLLRDRGIALNPRALSLYKELAWIFAHKMGGHTDDMHMAYKARWATLMQHLLAPPPYGETKQAIDAFRPIAEAPLDKDAAVQARELIQARPLAQLLQDKDVAAYARLLADLKVGIDPTLLDAYNRYGNDECLRAVRAPYAPPIDFQKEPQPDRARAVAELINSPEHAVARGKILAFIRAQILWNKYRMDPQWMLGLMEKYGPLDWRLTWPHAIYWSTYGFHKVENTPVESLERIESLNNSRMILNSLKDLTWRGRLMYVENPQRPNDPSITFFFDPRFVSPACDEFDRLIERSFVERTEVAEENVFRYSHLNYLVNVIELLYPLGRHEQAVGIMNYLKAKYNLHGNEWDMDLEDFVAFKLNVDGRPTPERAEAQIGPSLQTAYLLQLKGNDRDYRRYLRYASRIHSSYQAAAPQAQKLATFESYQRGVLMNLLVRPRAVGYNLDLGTRVHLFGLLDLQLQQPIYDYVAPSLRAEFKAQGLDFEKVFPEPRGMKEYRKQAALGLPG